MQNSLKSLLLCLRNGALGNFSPGREMMETRYSSSMPLTPIPLILLPEKTSDFNFLPCWEEISIGIHHQSWSC